MWNLGWGSGAEERRMEGEGKGGGGNLSATSRVATLLPSVLSHPPFCLHLSRLLASDTLPLPPTVLCSLPPSPPLPPLRHLSAAWGGSSLSGSITPRPLFDTGLPRATSSSSAVGADAGVTMIAQQNKALQVRSIFLPGESPKKGPRGRKGLWSGAGGLVGAVVLSQGGPSPPPCPF